MIATCALAGWRAAARNGKLVLTVWAWNALLALVAGFATWRWLDAAFAYAPESGRLLDRFHIGLFVELMQYDRFSPITSLGGAVLGLALLAAISNPLLAAGVLESIVADDSRPLLHRFLRGAGHFFGRFFRLLVISVLAGVALVLVASLITSPVLAALSASAWERTWIAAGLLRNVLFVMLLALVVAILDVARADVVTAPVELRGMLRAWVHAARRVFGDLGTVAALGLVYVAGFLAMLAAYAIVSGLIPGRGWLGIVVLVSLQQAFMVGRAGLRVARTGAAVQFCRKEAVVSAPVLQP